MRKLASTVLAALWVATLAAAATAPTPAGDSLDEVVRHLQAHYDATTDFTADVIHEIEMASLGKTTRSHGKVYFKRPGRMRWELTNQEEQLIIADGDSLWVYQPKDKQVYKASFSQAFRSTTPVSFLTGIGRLREDFEVSADGSSDDIVYLRLVPKKGAEIGTLRLGIDRNTYDVREAEIHDPLGNATRLTFSNIKRDVGLDDSLFHFTIPPGTEVIQAPGSSP